jgi:hypothetical protein
MKKADWYENRILWRAAKLQLDTYLWRNFLISHKQDAKSILDAIGEAGVPLIVFWSNDELWTLLTNEFLVGRWGGRLSLANLDSLGEIVTVNDRGLSPAELKRSADCISVGFDGKRFWTPVGSCHFSLINILRMFPIGIP